MMNKPMKSKHLEKVSTEFGSTLDLPSAESDESTSILDQIQHNRSKGGDLLAEISLEKSWKNDFREPPLPPHQQLPTFREIDECLHGVVWNTLECG